jgi:hypothetical protein
MECQALRSAVIEHYASAWERPWFDQTQMRGPGAQQMRGFSVLAFGPRPSRQLWTYATCGMSCGESDPQIELHLLSPTNNLVHVETLTAIAHYHLTGNHIKTGDTVNFGRPWLGKSLCEFGLISLPYLDGPKVEICNRSQSTIHCLWLIPITREERDFKIQFGLEALEQKFQATDFNYADPRRQSVV